MKVKYANAWKILLWVSVVYILSFLCYVPTWLVQHGIAINNGLLFFKYLFVCIPAITSILFLIFEHKLKGYLAHMFSGKTDVRHVLIWVIFMAAGIFVSYAYWFTTKDDVFQNTYSSTASLLISCIYLYITALAEETAWRGFLLERVSCKKKGICSILLVGMIWTVWHMPMWIIRNSLDIQHIIPLCIWTLLVSVVLGIIHYQCENILFTALLHATFNICYLAPIQYNIAVVAIAAAAGALFIKKKSRDFR